MARACVYARESRRARKRKRLEPAGETTQAIVGVCEVRHEDFSNRFLLKAAVIRSRHPYRGKDTHVMIWEQTLRIYSEEAGGCVGVAAKPLNLGIKGLQDEESIRRFSFPAKAALL